MVLKEFDPKLMRFLYFLATHQKKMNSVEASREAKKEGWDLSDRTIRRWFSWFNRKNYINYFLNLKWERFGLVQVYVLIEQLNSKDLISKIPFVSYYTKGISLISFKNVSLIQYHIPFGYINKFYKFWNASKKYNLIKNFKLYPHKTSLTFYYQFDKIINGDGYIQFKEENLQNNYFIKLHNEFSGESSDSNNNNFIIQNPMVIPLAYSGVGENYSSQKIWNFLKEKSKKIWGFIPKKLLHRGKKDGIAIKYIQEVMKLIDNHRNELFQQMRVSYKPFYQGRHNTYYLILKIKNKKRWKELLFELHKRTLQLNYTPCCKEDIGILYIVTNENKFLEIVQDVLPKYIDYSYDNKLILQESDPNKNYYGKVDWTMFDPVKKEWIYEHEKYMKELKKLARCR